MKKSEICTPLFLLHVLSIITEPAYITHSSYSGNKSFFLHVYCIELSINKLMSLDCLRFYKLLKILEAYNLFPGLNFHISELGAVLQLGDMHF